MVRQEFQDEVTGSKKSLLYITVVATQPYRTSRRTFLASLRLLYPAPRSVLTPGLSPTSIRYRSWIDIE